MKECIFCKIVNGEAPSYKVWEDKDYIAILDIYPNIKGQTLVIQKKHDESYVFGLSDAKIVKLAKAIKKVANLLEKKLKVKRVHAIFEGTGVDHLHVKLYPAIRYGESPEPSGVKPVRFERYPGYVTSAGGLEASEEELKAIQKEITS